MTAKRLPTPGKDGGIWGGILNDFLLVEHNADGTLKKAADISQALTKATSAVQSVNGKTGTSVSLSPSDVGAPTQLAQLTDVNATGASNNQVLSYNGTTDKWSASTVSSTTVSDASNTNKGIVQLAGDLAGGNDPTTPTITAAAITSGKIASGTISDTHISSSANIAQSKISNLTTNLSAKATDTAVVHNTGAETVAGIKTFSSAPVVPSGSFPESAVTNLTSDLAAKYTKPGGGIPKTDLTAAVQTSLSTADARNAVALQGTSVDSSAPSDGQALVYSLGAGAWIPNTVTSSGTISDATTGSKGIVQLAGDLAGTATSPTVPGLTAKADDSAVVHKTGAETVAGVKTFSSAPVLPSAALPESAVANLTSDLAAKANTSSLATIATSGAYSDLTGKPTIPTAGTGSGTYAAGDDSRITGAAQKSQNLSDLSDAATARTNLGLDTAATQATSYFAPAGGPVPAAYAATNDNRFTGATTTKQVADYTLALSDAGGIIEAESASNLTVTVPASTSVAFQDGTLIEISQTGAGQVTLAPATDVTLSNAGGLKTRTQWSSMSLRKRPGGGSALSTTNLLLRYNADDITGANNSPVSSWSESSGNNYPAATQATSGSQPKLVTNALNGHNGVAFNGTSNFLSLSGAALNLAQNIGTMSVFVVYTTTSASSGSRTLFSLSTGTSSSNQRVIVSHRNSSGNNIVGIRRNDADSLTYINGTLVTGAETVCLGGVINFTGGSMQLYRNGTQTGTTTITSGSTSNTASLAGALGGNPDGASGLLLGTIAEVLVYSSIDSGSRANVSTYVQSTYGISMADALSGTDEWVVTGDTSV